MNNPIIAYLMHAIGSIERYQEFITNGLDLVSFLIGVPQVVGFYGLIICVVRGSFKC
jgi:hypothetical protein